MTSSASNAMDAAQGVQDAAGCAYAQVPPGHHASQGGSFTRSIGDYDAMSSFAKSAAKLGGKQLRSFSEAGFKYLAGQYESWRGGPIQQGPDSPAAAGMQAQQHLPH